MINDDTLSLQDAESLIKWGVKDDVISTITMFISGLYGLHSVNVAFSKFLSTDNTNHTISLLSAVPSYVAMATEFSEIESDIGILISNDSKVEDMQRILDKNPGDTQDSALYRGVANFVLVDKLLDESYCVYDTIQDAVSASLIAAMAQLKSSKHTKMSAKALV